MVVHESVSGKFTQTYTPRARYLAPGSVKDVPEHFGKDVMELNTLLGKGGVLASFT